MKSRLIEILGVQSYSYDDKHMRDYLHKVLDDNGYAYYLEDGSFYITKGRGDNGYPCVVAHIDTVHKVQNNLTVLEVDGCLTGIDATTMMQTGVGGDDKVGIYIALQCLDYFDDIKVVLFRDEEVGCDGSYNADIEFFNDVNFVLQCDRQGNRDFVTEACGVSLSSVDFRYSIIGVLDSHGYSLCDRGGMTDVMALKESGILCSMANISCGYYNPHTNYEYVNIDDVFNCERMVKEIISLIGNINYPHKYEKSRYSYYALPKAVSPTKNKEKKQSMTCIDCFDEVDYNSTGRCTYCDEYDKYRNKFSSSIKL